MGHRMIGQSVPTTDRENPLLPVIPSWPSWWVTVVTLVVAIPFLPRVPRPIAKGSIPGIPRCRMAPRAPGVCLMPRRPPRCLMHWSIIALVASISPRSSPRCLLQRLPTLPRIRATPPGITGSSRRRWMLKILTIAIGSCRSCSTGCLQDITASLPNRGRDIDTIHGVQATCQLPWLLHCASLRGRVAIAPASSSRCCNGLRYQLKQLRL